MPKTKKKPTAAQKSKVKTVMHEWKQGKLHIGKSDKIVTTQKQAVAIALNESGLSNRKKKKDKSRKDAVTPNIALALKQVIDSVYRDGIDAVLSYTADTLGGISGLFRDGREVFNYTITSSGQISYVEVPSKRGDAYLEGYYLAGRVPDSSVSNAYTRSVLDAELARLDAKKPRNCSTGKSCGNTCIAKGLKCVQQIGTPQQQVVQKISQEIRNKKAQEKSATDVLKRHAPIIAGIAGATGLLGAATIGVAMANQRDGKSASTPSFAGTPTRSQTTTTTSQPPSKKKPSGIEDPWDGPEPDPWDDTPSSKSNSMSNNQSTSSNALSPGKPTEYKRSLVPKTPELRQVLNKAKRERTGLNKAKERLELAETLKQNTHSAVDRERGTDMEANAKDTIANIKGRLPKKSVEGSLTRRGTSWENASVKHGETLKKNKKR